ncbi:LacI family DNA-binding transcriptional regulator [Parafrankia sp. FMc2]|uniref:LacI family DNA-binding transcriptional regulator n=1 Tax=Parafrankia sp. FMc2 TaxID=3233196 RepID=UPI0034D6B0FD
MTKRVTIGDVAAHAGVSTATVSRVLNGGPVTPPTAARVWETVTRLGYTPNALTRGIFAGRSRTIGVVVRDLSSPFYLDLMRGIDDVAAAHDSLVMFTSTFRPNDHEAALVGMMDEHRVRGLIATTDESTDGRLRQLAENGTPCVIVARAVPGAGVVPGPPPALHSISLDNVAAGRLMATHLAACGRSSVGVVTSGDRSSQLGRLAGLRNALTGLGLPLPESAVTVAQSVTEVDRAVGLLLGRARDQGRPLDAIACTAGRLTVAAHTALTARGLAMPGDIAFLTMDDFAWAPALGITVITQPAYRMGRRAAELVVESPGETVAVLVEPSLVARRSCGEAQESREVLRERRRADGRHDQ